MQPEISRRCLVCGAAPRAGAQFCPQCGSSLKERGAEAQSPDAQPEARAVARGEVAGGKEEVARAFEAWRGGAAGAGDEARDADAAGVAAAAGEVKSAGEAPSSKGGAGAEESSPAPPLEEAAGPSSALTEEQPPSPQPRRPVMPEPLAPTSAPVAGEDEGAASSSAKPAGAVGATRRRAASVVKESIAPRVERVRDRSIVMLDEAPDDSGLRFVLLAALLFALFVLLFVLNTVIK